MLFLRDRQTADDPAWNLSSYLLFHAAVPDGLLTAGLNEIIRKNDALRLRPVFRDGGVFLDVDPYVPRVYRKFTFDTQEAFLRWAEGKINTSVFGEPGMWTAYIIGVSGRSGILNIGHHAMSDGLNVVILYRQLIRYLSGELPEERSFIPHLEAMEAYRRSDRMERDGRFWQDLLKTDYQPRLFSAAAGPFEPCVNEPFSLDTDTVCGMEAFCEENGFSESTLLYAAAAAAAYSLSRAERFSLGIPVLGRSTQNEMQTMGLFMHIVPMIADVRGQTFRSFLQYVQEQVFDLFRHRRFTAYDIMFGNGRRPSGGPRYDISVDYSVYEPLPDCSVRALYNGYISVAMEIHFLKQADRRLDCMLRTARSVCSEPLAARFRTFLTAVIEAILKTPDAEIAGTSLLPERERDDVLYRFNDTAAPYRSDKSIYDLFAEQAQKTGLAAGITEENKKYTFAQLDADAAKIDAYIRRTAGEKKQVIGVLCDRSYAELASIFGAVRGGNAYMPISPEHPAARIETLLAESGCTLVLAQTKYVGLNEKAKSVEEILSAPAPSAVPAPAAKPEDTLYVIFTSGSTGVPKGAMVSNRSAVNRIEWMARKYFNGSTVVMRKTPYTFDVSVWEIFGFAIAGFSLYILPPEEHYLQERVLSHIEKGGVTDLHFVPTVFGQFLAALKNTPDAKQKLRSLRHVILSGESLAAKDVNAFRQYPGGQITLHNLYGPAECAVDVTYYDCAETETDPVPIGKPISNTQIYILDAYLQPVPVGVTGELCIAGDNVGQGYLNRPELTKEKFITNPFGAGKLYRTGDLAYRREDGNIVFVGRLDHQVKINGQRIEPGEIEACLSLIGGIESAAVTARSDETGRRYLCAYYTGREMPAPELRAQLSRTLPRYMTPHFFVHLDAMPLTSSGKLDRLALPAVPAAAEPDDERYEPPKTPAEEEICSVFGSVLGIERVGRTDSFYDLGGTSLDMIRLLGNGPLAVLTPAAFMEDPTPAALAEKLARYHTGTAKYLQPLYVPETARRALVLFPYGGGDASAYAALVAVFRRQKADIALYYTDWMDESDYPPAAKEIRELARDKQVYFYSHCAGAVIAMKLLDLLNAGQPTVRGYIAGANVPAEKYGPRSNIWRLLSDRAILRVLARAGLPVHEMEPAQKESVLRRFRRNTDEYFSYFAEKTEKTPCNLTVIVSKDDLFTKNFRYAYKLWSRYVTFVRGEIIAGGKTHYFQSENSEFLYETLMSVLLGEEG